MPDAHNDPQEYMSASRLKSFLTCRLKLFQEKVLSLPAPISPNLQIGKAVHVGLVLGKEVGKDWVSENVPIYALSCVSPLLTLLRT